MDSYTTDQGLTEDKLATQATDGASSAIRSTQSAAQGFLNRVVDGATTARDQVSPAIDRVATTVDSAARRGIAAARDTSAQVRERAQKASDITINYIQQEPLKAVLVAAATGAVLMALLGMMSRSRH